MRHKVKGRKLGRTASHRTATLRSLATALFRHKKIKTTLAKAKQAKIFIEPLITRAKVDSVANRRYVARHINDKKIVQELFGEIIEKIGDRPGGYLRIVKLGQRLGDAAEMAILELVDFSDAAPRKAGKPKKEKDTKVKEAIVADEVKETSKEKIDEVKEEPKTEATKENDAEDTDESVEEKPEDNTEDKSEDTKETK
ncbi:MAG: 50S ribosomal protein L17 [Melioribacteraceae bacterium]|nr:50S ribosomal protein L17 [Melioribacteraceae bacterium]MCO6474553.1 50S ribosomal protein L17 [Melioribacteraceae bacterium]